MKYLFVHQNFPGQYLHILKHLAARGRDQIVFLTEPNANHLAGVRKVVYHMGRGANTATHPDAREFELASLRAETVARTAMQLKRLGFTPDIIIGHHGWGELLNIRDVWPETPLLGYFEFFYHTAGMDVGFDPEFPPDPSLFPRIRAKNTVNLLALTMGGHGQTPTLWQRATFPAWAATGIEILPEGADLALCKPLVVARRQPLVLGEIRIAPGEKLVTYVARNLEPYRGFHVMVRALARVLAARQDVRAVLVGGDEVSYGMKPPEGGTWRARMLAELGGKIDPARVHFPGKVAYRHFLALLRRSDAHVYLTYPFVASWSLREALAMGAPVIGSDTEPVREFVRDRHNGLLTPCLDPVRLAERILELIEDEALARRLSVAARRYAEKHLRMQDHIAGYRNVVRSLTCGVAI
ncbi:MAG TPA: glycosyltransferase family 4 protein [Acetobacteraceae bacterium]|nr:glycosyltransferase family 4 protein [Acetobacteraceae bacterium]